MVKQIRNKRPGMVDVGDKNVTHRVARARALVDLPPPVARQLRGDELISRKGPVFQTAVVAGIMAAKRTSAIIPLCHPLGIEDCKIDIRVVRRRQVVIECSVSMHGKTGVEMEALTGAVAAALTIYDMCKGLSHDIVIHDVRLLEKHGGKSDYVRA
ncbi:MAG TPA: cyclic pyranopterin monophosphate synthase MoaC [Kiritimatiellia bacterium]|nr:cyclic pyranopterin monophosphate synthase MoaC [Kiritimatiellia bacterium]